MKRLFLGVLGLTAGCMASFVHAQELQWEAVKPKTTIQTTKYRGQMGQELEFESANSNDKGSEFGTGVQRASFNRLSEPALPRLTELPREPQTQPPSSSPDDSSESLFGGESAPMPRKVTPRITPTPQETPTNQDALSPVPEHHIQGPGFYPGAIPPNHRPPMAIPTAEGHGEIIGPDWSGCPGGTCVDGPAHDGEWIEDTHFGFGHWGGHGGWLTGWGGMGNCFGRCCGPRADCRPTFYLNGEYLHWYVDDPNLPPLVTGTTVSPEVLVGIPRPGALGELGTNLLFGGGQGIDSPSFPGGRFTVGLGLPRYLKGIEATFLFLGEQSISFSAASDDRGLPGLYRPFFDPIGNEESALSVAFPILSSGQIDIEHQTRLWGAEFNFRKNLICGCQHQLDLLGGFRFLELAESLNIRQRSVGLVDNPTNPDCMFSAGNVTVIEESFATRNRFYGGQVGLDWTIRHGCWFVGVTSKLALGNMHQTVTIQGNTFTTPLGMPTVATSGGLLARPSNIGVYSRDQFAVIPEVGVKLGYNITDRLSAYVAYNFLYVSAVARPGDQIDRTVNLTAPPGLPQGGVSPTRPLFIFQDTGFWAQGWSVGLKWQY
ncbi:MAG: BBP7 family outer membrane beta-barrel protein [Gemmataceae bacterium]